MKKYLVGAFCLLFCLAALCGTLAEEDHPEKDFYPNGAVRNAYTYDDQGRMIRQDHFNRFGMLTSYLINETFDAQGNALTYTWNYPDSSPKYRTYHYAAEYDQAGNVIFQSSKYADGSPGSSWSAAYDDRGRIASMTYYDAQGNISEYSVNYLYDAEDHLISTQDLNPDRSLKSTYIAEWKNGIRTRWEELSPTGEILSYEELDDFGSEIFWYYAMPEEDYYSRSVTSYSTSGYETEDWSFDHTGKVSWHDLTRYNASGPRTEVVSYMDDGSQTLRTYRYDGIRKVVLEENVEETDIYGGVESYKVTYEYDSQDREILQTTHYPNGTARWVTQTVYEADGTHKTQTDYYNEDGTFWFSGDWY